MSVHVRDTIWCLSQLHTSCANIAYKNLKRQSLQPLLPIKEVTRQSNGKFITATRALFSGYIFVACGFWWTDNSTYRITQLMRFVKEPTAKPLNLVSLLMRRCGVKGNLLLPKSFKIDDHMTITKRLFANFGAEIENVIADGRAWVLMKTIGGHTRVSVGTDRLQAS